MGQVFRAYDLTTRRDVALKIMWQKVEERQRARFVREGELIAKLDHPGILRIHGGGASAEGCPFLVLELVEGARTLDEVLVEDFEGGLHLLHHVARAVGHAHSQGVVHRDLKPSNVLVDAVGRARVCDFGIAWSSDAERLTRPGELVGTLLYMAPECFSSKLREAQPTVDVWALGVILYEHLTGRLPFESTSLAELMCQISAGQVEPPRALRPEVSPAVEAVCLRALSRDPKGRFPDGDAFADALDVAAARGRRRRSPALAACALAIAGLVILLLSLAFRIGEARPPPPKAKDPLAAVESDTPRVVAVAEPRDPERALAAVVRESHVPIGLRQEVLAGFDRVARLASGDAAMTARVRLERLDYLYRRGRWERVLNDASALEDEPGPIGARATLILALSVYALDTPGAPAEARARAACRARWERPELKRSADDLACGAWLALFERKSELALERAQLAQRLHPDLLPALLAEAVAWGRALNIPKALALVERALELAPDHPLPWSLLDVCQTHLEKHEAALEATQQLLSLVSPDPPWAVCKARFRSLFTLERTKEIEEFANQGLVDNPTDPRWGFMLGFVLATRSPARRWRGLELLHGIRRTAPEVFQRNLDSLLRQDDRDLFLRQLDEATPARIQVGLLYEEAWRLSAGGDHARSNELLRVAAAAGLPEAMNLLGEHYFLGKGVPKDDLQARRWLRKAAEAGHPSAAFYLGSCYAQGRGVSRDPAQALRWFLVAAEGGNVGGMVNLADAYRQGWGGAPDDQQAARWLERAAATGNATAMLNLGRLHAETGSPEEADRWWREAIERGDEETRARAAHNLETLLLQHPELR